MANPYANLVKLLKAITLLSQPSGTTINALMDRLKVSRRTVFRLLEALDDLGFPVIDDYREFGGPKVYRLLDSFVQRLPNIALPGLSFTQREAQLLQAVLDRGHIFPDTEAEPAIESLRTKLETILKGQDQAPSCDPSRVEDSKLLSQIRTAILGHRVCAMRYHSFEPAGSHLYVVHPLRLFEDSGAFFLFVGLPSHGAVRLIPVDRIASIEVLDNVFIPPQEATADGLAAKAFDLSDATPISVSIRFTPKVSAAAQRYRMSPDQRAIKNPDGSCTLSFTTTEDADLLAWISSFGPEAEILAPEGLRLSLRGYLAKALALY